MVAQILLAASGVYLGAGFAFAAAFVWRGAAAIDPHAAQGSWGFRVLIIPGTVLLWPLLLFKWIEARRAEQNAKTP